MLQLLFVVLVGHLELPVDILVDLGRYVHLRQHLHLVDIPQLNQLLLLLQHHHLVLHHQNLLVELLLIHIGVELGRVLHERKLRIWLPYNLLILVKVCWVLIEDSIRVAMVAVSFRVNVFVGFALGQTFLGYHHVLHCQVPLLLAGGQGRLVRYGYSSSLVGRDCLHFGDPLLFIETVLSLNEAFFDCYIFLVESFVGADDLFGEGDQLLVPLVVQRLPDVLRLRNLIFLRVLLINSLHSLIG